MAVPVSITLTSYRICNFLRDILTHVIETDIEEKLAINGTTKENFKYPGFQDSLFFLTLSSSFIQNAVLQPSHNQDVNFQIPAGDHSNILFAFLTTRLQSWILTCSYLSPLFGVNILI